LKLLFLAKSVKTVCVVLKDREKATSLQQNRSRKEGVFLHEKREGKTRMEKRATASHLLSGKKEKIDSMRK